MREISANKRNTENGENENPAGEQAVQIKQKADKELFFNTIQHFDSAIFLAEEANEKFISSGIPMTSLKRSELSEKTAYLITRAQKIRSRIKKFSTPEINSSAIQQAIKATAKLENFTAQIERVQASFSAQATKRHPFAPLLLNAPNSGDQHQHQHQHRRAQQPKPPFKTIAPSAGAVAEAAAAKKARFLGGRLKNPNLAEYGVVEAANNVEEKTVHHSADTPKNRPSKSGLSSDELQEIRAKRALLKAQAKTMNPKERDPWEACEEIWKKITENARHTFHPHPPNYNPSKIFSSARKQQMLDYMNRKLAAANDSLVVEGDEETAASANDSAPSSFRASPQ